MSSTGGWIGFDLDGTLAHYDRWVSVDHIGKPIEPMLKLVRDYLDKGQEVRIFTARVGPQRDPHERERARVAIQNWCREYIGEVLIVTNEKDFGMILLYDDRCVSVEKNTGRITSEPLPH